MRLIMKNSLKYTLDCQNRIFEKHVWQNGTPISIMDLPVPSCVHHGMGNP